jgi:hypothetical protein
MGRIKGFALVLVLVFLTAVCITAVKPAKAQFTTIIVPDDYPTITAAIGNATNGDTIFVRSGIYHEQMLDINKSVALIGEDASNTIIELYPPSGPYGILGSWGIDNPVKIEANDASLSNFTITSHGSPPPATNGGFVSATGNGIEIIGNTINTGISAVGNETVIANNTVTALFLSGADQTIAQNTISGGGYGIWMEGSVNDFVVKNNVTIATTETVSSPTQLGGNGMELRSSTLNQIVANNIYADICVQIDNYYDITNLQTRSSDDNIFYENNFISSSSTFIDQVGNGNGVYSVHNIWCNGTEGNYWSDYLTRYPNATEIDNSGVGDTPYVIDANNIDPYPLMAPYSSSILNVSPVPSPSPSPTQSSSSSEQPTNSPKFQLPEPFPTATVAAASVLAVVVVAGLLVYFKKRKR